MASGLSIRTPGELPVDWEDKIHNDAKVIMASTKNVLNSNGMSKKAKMGDSYTGVLEMIKLIKAKDCDNAHRYVSHARTEPEQEPLLYALLGDEVGASYIEQLLEIICPDWTPPASQDYSPAASVSGGRRLKPRKTRNRRNKRRGSYKKRANRK